MKNTFILLSLFFIGTQNLNAQSECDWGVGDLNGDTYVDVQDLLIILGAFGEQYDDYVETALSCPDFMLDAVDIQATASNPTGVVVETDNVFDTDNVTVLEMSITADAGCMTLYGLDFLLNISDSIPEVINRIELVHEGIQVASIIPTNSMVSFSGLDYFMNPDETIEFIVRVDILESSNYPEGTTIECSFDSLQGDNGQNGEILPEQIIGTVTGDIYLTYYLGQCPGFVLDELDIDESNDSPNSTIFEVSEDNESGWNTVLVFEINSDGGCSNLTEIICEVNTYDYQLGNNIPENVINDARLVFNGEVLDSSIPVGNNLTFILPADFWLDLDQTVDFEIELKFNEMDYCNNYCNGTEIRVDVTNIEGFDGQGNIIEDWMVNSVYGETHALYDVGLILDFDYEDAYSTNEAGYFEIWFDACSFGEDVYISQNVSEYNSNNEINASIHENGTCCGSGIYSGTIYSPSNAEDYYGNEPLYRIQEGDCESFEITVVFDPNNSGIFNASIDNIPFLIDPNSGSWENLIFDNSDFETEAIYISGGN